MARKLYAARPSRHSDKLKAGIYDSKYHPMDDALRPEPESEADEKSGTEAGSEHPGESEDDSSDEDAQDSASPAGIPEPDPKALRHSSRAASQKPVDYSAKHHPQDHSLPGRRAPTSLRTSQSTPCPQKRRADTENDSETGDRPRPQKSGKARKGGKKSASPLVLSDDKVEDVVRPPGGDTDSFELGSDAINAVAEAFRAGAGGDNALDEEAAAKEFSDAPEFIKTSPIVEGGSDLAAKVPAYIKNRLAIKDRPLTSGTVLQEFLQDTYRSDNEFLNIVKPYDMKPPQELLELASCGGSSGTLRDDDEVDQADEADELDEDDGKDDFLDSKRAGFRGVR